MKEGALERQITEEDIKTLPIREQQELQAIEHNINQALLHGVVPDPATVQRVKEILSHVHES